MYLLCFGPPMHSRTAGRLRRPASSSKLDAASSSIFIRVLTYKEYLCSPPRCGHADDSRFVILSLISYNFPCFPLGLHLLLHLFPLFLLGRHFLGSSYLSGLLPSENRSYWPTNIHLWTLGKVEHSNKGRRNKTLVPSAFLLSRCGPQQYSSRHCVPSRPSQHRPTPSSTSTQQLPAPTTTCPTTSTPWRARSPRASKCPTRQSVTSTTRCCQQYVCQRG